MIITEKNTWKKEPYHSTICYASWFDYRKTHNDDNQSIHFDWTVVVVVLSRQWACSLSLTHSLNCPSFRSVHYVAWRVIWWSVKLKRFNRRRVIWSNIEFDSLFTKGVNKLTVSVTRTHTHTHIHLLCVVTWIYTSNGKTQLNSIQQGITFNLIRI